MLTGNDIQIKIRHINGLESFAAYFKGVYLCEALSEQAARAQALTFLNRQLKVLKGA